MSKINQKTLIKSLVLSLILGFVSSCATTYDSGSSDTRGPAAKSKNDQVEKLGDATYVSPKKPINFNPKPKDLVVSNSKDFKACGYLHGVESNRVALNNEDEFFVVEILCDVSALGSNGKVGNPLLKLERKNMLPQQRGWVSRWREAAAKKYAQQDGVAASAPLLCFKGQVNNDLCRGDKYGVITQTEKITSVMKNFNNKGW